MSNIRDRDKLADSLVDWAFLAPAWGGTKARPCDVDGGIEQDGHLLDIEAKETGYLWTPQSAQFRRLKTLSRKPACNAIVLYGMNPWDFVTTHLEVVRPPSLPRHIARIEADNDKVIALCARWFQHTHECQSPSNCLYDFLEEAPA